MNSKKGLDMVLHAERMSVLDIRLVTVIRKREVEGDEPLDLPAYVLGYIGKVLSQRDHLPQAIEMDRDVFRVAPRDLSKLVRGKYRCR
jgi:hypothetical protein